MAVIEMRYRVVWFSPTQPPFAGAVRVARDVVSWRILKANRVPLQAGRSYLTSGRDV